MALHTAVKYLVIACGIGTIGFLIFFLFSLQKDETVELGVIIPKEHLLKAPKNHIVASINLPNGVKKYAYFTDILPEIQEGVRVEYNQSGYKKLEGAGIGLQTKPDGTQHIVDNHTIFSGGAQHVPVNGVWRQVERSTTTIDAFNLQVSTPQQRKMARIYDVLDFFPTALAAACTDADPCFPSVGAAEPPDGYIERGTVDETFAIIRNNTGSSINILEIALNLGFTEGSATTNQFSRLRKTQIGFDARSVTGTVTAAAIDLTANANETIGLGNTNLEFTSATSSSESTLVAGDYAATNYGSTTFASFSINTWPAPGIHVQIALNAAGMSYITAGDAVSSGDYTVFGVRTTWDLNNSFTGTWANGGQTNAQAVGADETGTGTDPKLTATTSVAVAAAEFIPENGLFLDSLLDKMLPLAYE